MATDNIESQPAAMTARTRRRTIEWRLVRDRCLADFRCGSARTRMLPSVVYRPKEEKVPTISVQRTITIEDVANALREQLGSSYELREQVSGSHEALKVKQGAGSTATVRLTHDGSATTLHVHGGGLLITRAVNELGVAKKVAAAITAAFPPAAPVDADQEQHAQ